MATTNSIALTATGLVGYDGAGTFNATTISQSNVVIGGGSTSTYAGVAAPGNVGTPLISNGGAGTAPVFGTAQVRGGGTGLATLSTYQIMAGGTSATGDMQQLGIGSSGQVLVSNGAGALATFQTRSSVGTWSDQSGSFTAAVGNGYFCTAALTLTLPAAPVEGSSVIVFVDAAASIVVTGNTGQLIRVGANLSISGGTATNATQGSAITLVYRSSTSTWNSISTEGTWIVV